MKKHLFLLFALFAMTLQAWAAEYKFLSGTTIYVDFTDVNCNGKNGVNYPKSSSQGYDYKADGCGTFMEITFTSNVTWKTDQTFLKTDAGGWESVKFKVPGTGQNWVRVNAAGKDFTWDTYNPSAPVVSFDNLPSSVEVNEEITFAATSQNVTNPVYTYYVNDAAVSNPYTFTGAGNYTIKVEVRENGAGGAALASQEKQLTVMPPAQDYTVYFKNTLSWSNVYIHFYNEDYTLSGNWCSGKKAAANPGAMTHVSGVYYSYTYHTSTPYTKVCFTEENQDNYDNFYNNKCSWSDAMNLPSGKVLWVPDNNTSESKNSCTYYNTGEWKVYPEVEPLVAFDNLPAQVAINNPVTFVATSQNVTNPAYTYYVNNQAVSNPYTFTGAGNYTVKVEVRANGTGDALATAEQNVQAIALRTFDGTERLFFNVAGGPSWWTADVQTMYFKDIDGNTTSVVGTIIEDKIYGFLVPAGSYTSVYEQRGTWNKTGDIPLSGTETYNYITSFSENSTTVTWDTYVLDINPVVHFDNLPSLITMNVPITFAAISQNVTNPVYTYYVNDAVVSNPYTFTGAGDYTIKVEVRANGAGDALAQEEKVITVRTAPIVYVMKEQDPSSSLSFTALSEDPTLWAWDSNNGDAKFITSMINYPGVTAPETYTDAIGNIWYKFESNNAACENYKIILVFDGSTKVYDVENKHYVDDVQENGNNNDTFSSDVWIVPQGANENTARLYTYYPDEVITTYAVTIANDQNEETDIVYIGSNVKQVNAPELVGYKFANWTKEGDIAVADLNANPASVTATGQGKLTAHYTEMPMIYFKNVRNWEKVYMHLFDSEVWGSQGVEPGNHCYQYVRMTLVPGTTDLYCASYEGTPVSLAFANKDMHNYGQFYEAEACYRTDFDACRPSLVMNGENKTNDVNNTKYYNEGYWQTLDTHSYHYLIYGVPNEASSTWAIADNRELMRADANSNLAKLTLPLAEGIYNFKLVLHDDCLVEDVYLSNASTIEGGAWELPFNSNADNCTIVVPFTGEYTFTYNLAKGTLSVEYPNIEITISQYGYSTYYTNMVLAKAEEYPELEMSYVDGIQADGVHINMVPVPTAIAANQGVILHGAPNTTYSFKTYALEEDIVTPEVNWMKGTLETMDVEDNGMAHYILSIGSVTGQFGLYWPYEVFDNQGIGTFRNQAHKAYLEISREVQETNQNIMARHGFSFVNESSVITNDMRVRDALMQDGKFIINGMLYFYKQGACYNAQGQMLIK